MEKDVTQHKTHLHLYFFSVCLHQESYLNILNSFLDVSKLKKKAKKKYLKISHISIFELRKLIILSIILIRKTSMFFLIFITVPLNSALGIDFRNLKVSRPFVTLSRQRSLSYRNQSIYLLSKSLDWFLYDTDLRHERVNVVELTSHQ